jgi:hypothetical protein
MAPRALITPNGGIHPTLPRRRDQIPGRQNRNTPRRAYQTRRRRRRRRRARRKTLAPEERRDGTGREGGFLGFSAPRRSRGGRFCCGRSGGGGGVWCVCVGTALFRHKWKEVTEEVVGEVTARGRAPAGGGSGARWPVGA